MATTGARLMLLLATRDIQTAQQLAQTSALSLAEAMRQLAPLIAHGFVVAASAPGVEPALYRLSPKGAPPPMLAPHDRLLVVDDNLDVLDIMVSVLDDAGYAVVAATAPTTAVELLTHAAFDLVITDAFTRSQKAVLDTATDVVQAAGATPVALFTAHRVALDAAQAAGFRDVLHKPFDVAELLSQIQDLLGPDPVR